MLWDMHLCVFDVRLSFENRVHFHLSASAWHAMHEPHENFLKYHAKVSMLGVFLHCTLLTHMLNTFVSYELANIRNTKFQLWRNFLDVSYIYRQNFAWVL